MLQVVQNSVNLIELPFLIFGLLRELIAVRLTDGAVFIRPAVPNVRGKLMHVIALFLPNPKKLVHTGLKR